MAHPAFRKGAHLKNGGQEPSIETLFIVELFQFDDKSHARLLEFLINERVGPRGLDAG